jgi:hypothetical protein
VAALSLALLGCASSPLARLWPGPAFPPQTVIESGDYRSFLRENTHALQRCGGWRDCDEALFNLAFVYAYPESPYRDAHKARHYLAELKNRYPQSPWVSPGQMLLGFLEEQTALEEAQRRLRAELRTREATIRKLREQLHRSRDIDIEIERKQRELLR